MSQAGIINVIESNPTIPIYFEADTGFAVALFNVIRFVGTGGITTSASGNTITIDGSGSSPSLTLTGTTGGPLSPTLNNWNIFGGSVAAGTVPVQVNGSVSTLTVNVQKSQAIAATDATKVGLAAFDSTDFAVDANGFVTLAGGGAGQTITGDSGGPLLPSGGNWNLLGQTAGATTVFDTIGSASTLRFEDRSWLSRYVVDTSTTVGLRGTYSTLQAAITQAIADGATGVGATIYVRNCTIAETITISTAAVKINIIGTGFKFNAEYSGGNPLYTGSFTNSGSGNVLFLGIDFSGAASITNSSTGNIIIANCSCDATITNSGAGVTYCQNSQFNSNSITLSTGFLSANNSSFNAGTITLSGDGNYNLFNSDTTQNLVGSTSSEVVLANSYVNFVTNTLTGIIRTGQIGTAIGNNFYGNASATYEIAETAGNLYQSIRSATSYTAQLYDFYIGITDTSIARTVTLPSTAVKGQSFIIKDESGAAGTNNISVVVNGGVKTIDGTTSYAMNTNYGAIQVIYNGTNYFIF